MCTASAGLRTGSHWPCSPPPPGLFLRHSDGRVVTLSPSQFRGSALAWSTRRALDRRSRPLGAIRRVSCSNRWWHHRHQAGCDRPRLVTGQPSARARGLKRSERPRHALGSYPAPDPRHGLPRAAVLPQRPFPRTCVAAGRALRRLHPRGSHTKRELRRDSKRRSQNRHPNGSRPDARQRRSQLRRPDRLGCVDAASIDSPRTT